jgi:PmbA protein
MSPLNHFEQGTADWLDKLLGIRTPFAYECSLRSEQFRIVRFLHDRVHQDWSPSVNRVSLRTWRDGSLGQVSRTGLFDPESLLKEADACALQSELAECPLASIATVNAVQAMEAAKPEWDGLVSTLQEAAQARGLHMAGAVHEMDATNYVVSSLGARTGYRQSYLYVRLLLRHPETGLPGYAERIWREGEQADASSMFEEAAGYADLNQSPRVLEPGLYDLLLEPTAVADILRFVNILGLNGAKANRHESFLTLSAKAGDRVASPELTLWDDGTDPRGLVMPGDFEGTPKRHTPLIIEGRLEGLMYDRMSGAQAGRASTGHYNAPFGDDIPEGPIGYNLFVAPGTDSWSSIREGTARGLWVHRLQYSSEVEPELGTITASTQDGTFLAEKGRVTPVTDVRLTLSLKELLSHIDAVADTPKLCFDWWEPSVCVSPAYLIPPLRVSSMPARAAREP